MIPFPNKPARERRFELVLKPHLRRLYHLAFHLTGSQPDAEDLVQDLCIKLFPRLDELQALREPGPWLARVLYNQFIDQHRRRQSSPVDFVDELPDVASDAPGLEDVVSNQCRQERVLAALERLSVEHRAIVAWHDIEGYTLEELASRENIPLGTLKSRLHRARAQLRACLMEPFSDLMRVTG